MSVSLEDMIAVIAAFFRWISSAEVIVWSGGSLLLILLLAKILARLNR